MQPLVDPKQGAVALWSNASALDRKFEGSILAANSLFWANDRDARGRRRQIWKQKTKYETKNRRARERTLTRERARNRNEKKRKRLDPKLLSVNKKGLDSKDVMWMNDH